MSKGMKNKNSMGDKKAGKIKSESGRNSFTTGRHNDGYLISMSHAPRINEPSNIFQMIPVLFFTAIIIMITRMASYERPIDQFFWSYGGSKLNDFFSYYKMTAIMVCAVIALVLLLYRIFIQAFYIKRSFVYIPMIVYSTFVLLSYFFSDYKVFALLGWNDRFEGTLTLLSYMIMLIFVINTINTESNIKALIYTLGASSALLGLLGITQATGHDFFKSIIGKKMITPSWFWDKINDLNFTFQNEIYQTVYNINYVSFYLTLLLPLFGLLFIRSVMLGKEEPVYKKITWCALFTLLLYNLIGSASSGGLMGMAVAVAVAVVILNRRILEWWKPVCVLILVTILIAGVSYNRWMPELSNAVEGVTGSKAQFSESTTDVNNTKEKEASTLKHKLDYIITEDDNIILGYDGDTLSFKTFFDDPDAIVISDSSGSTLKVSPDESSSSYQLDDAHYKWIKVKPAKDDNNNPFIVLTTDEQDWPFLVTKDGPRFMNALGKLVDMNKATPSVGWESNPNFGSGRGFIWSRSLPMMKDTLVLGYGADTYCIYFPHNDYVGKYNADWNLNLIVDKPHNMYMGIAIGTGGVSLLALLVLWGFYLVQGVRIYWRQEYKSFTSYAGIGILLGICGFLAAGLVNDSSVSVMPMFYGLLGTGIVINMILENQNHN